MSECKTCINYCINEEKPMTPQEAMMGYVVYLAPCTFLSIVLFKNIISPLFYLISIILTILLCHGLLTWMRPFKQLWS
jgi:hypothetical protein